jgi:erythromycin esterase-like protein
LGEHLFHRKELAMADISVPETALPGLIARAARRLPDPDAPDFADAFDHLGAARMVLLGEASHGTSEFYRARAAITRRLVERHGFTIVAVEADWPDAALVDHHVRDRPTPRAGRQAFTRFPTWMWRNRETADFVAWLHAWNGRLEPERRVRFAGLDLYALHHSIDVVLQYLDRVDPAAAVTARQRYGCLTPWQRDPAEYGRAVLTKGYHSCEHQVTGQLDELLQRRIADGRGADEALFEALQNARLVAGAESYYRAMYYGTRESWNLRDRHMCDCLRELLAFHGAGAKAVVWAHNSHVGDARATEMAASGEWNLGQLCRQELGRSAVYTIGFGTDHGTVAAASDWGGPLEIKEVRPALDGSYERLCHDTGVASFLLPLRTDSDAVRVLSVPRLERAIGVIYRPETERASHWFQAELPRQFDEYVWFDHGAAVQPLPGRDTPATSDAPDTWPFGL